MRTYHIHNKEDDGTPLITFHIDKMFFNIMWLVSLMSIGAGLWEFAFRRWLVG